MLVVHELPLPVPFVPQLGSDIITFSMDYKSAQSLIENKIRTWFTNKYRMENPSIWDKLLGLIFSKD